MSIADSLSFTFSDLISGYVSTPAQNGGFAMRTTDGREYRVKLTDATYGEMMRNLGEPWQDPGAPVEDMLTPGRFVFAYGVFYPEIDDLKFEAKHLVFVGKHVDEWRFEEPDWWTDQIRRIADFYLKAQFPDGEIDYSKYRTHLTVEGKKIDSTRQEADTISRMVYGFASAFMVTGDERYLEAAEKGTDYLRDHFRAADESEGIAYWYHAIDVKGGHERKILASEFGDDYEAIPAYEQIYALAGPMQTYRATGDPRILKDAEMTIKLFDRFFRDPEKGGYFSHIDPIGFDPRDPTLTHNRARKNWNSVGDHAPAYLINLCLATGDNRYLEMLLDTANTIEAHFPDYDNSPFVNEKFFEDWSHDLTTPLQKNRAIVGHNLKIAWNLTRVHNQIGDDKYIAFCKKIAELMPKWGMDKQRGGFYDMVERSRQRGEEYHRLIWHDRKAWWQQEQGILCYLIMAGTFQDPEYLRLARESAAFYNAWFPDNDSGGVYFNVLASGTPYLLGTERLKGSHSMSGYHSTELCYLAAIYTNLLLTKEPMEFYFRPKVGALKDNILRVAPDMLPAGSVRLEAVWIDGESYADFDPETMSIRLPAVEQDDDQPHQMQMRPVWMGDPRIHPAAIADVEKDSYDVRVRIAPAGLTFDMDLTLQGGIADLEMIGVFDDKAALALKTQLSKAVTAQAQQLVLNAERLESLSPACARAIAFVEKKLPEEVEVYLVGANDQVKATLQDVGVLEELLVQDAHGTQVPA